jgi:predicted nuclease of predicted toxin-antitoxin system
MKLLLDECAPKRLKNDFPGHDIQTVDDVGLKGLKNGELLPAAAEQFDVLITVDRWMQFQQNLLQLNLALVVLVAKPCRYAQLRNCRHLFRYGTLCFVFPGLLFVCKGQRYLDTFCSLFLCSQQSLDFHPVRRYCAKIAE